MRLRAPTVAPFDVAPWDEDSAPAAETSRAPPDALKRLTAALLPLVEATALAPPFDPAAKTELLDALRAMST
eukprot:2528067-Prymnesium_polylepis.2